jgi:predicted pyridoxine 5'-phosphate oxidase superfamily flavin-nucleotide-binding protein
MTTPFHDEELKAQALAGGGASGSGIRAFMPDQHRTFFALLPYIFVGVIDDAGWPIATLLTGAPGFVRALDAVTLRIDALPDILDPAAPGFVEGRDIALLGLDFATRRRNRANGRLTRRDARGMTVAVRQSFGNCARYIQSRTIGQRIQARSGIDALAALDPAAKALIERADTFFVATRARHDAGVSHGADMSHRGGRPGFVRVEGDTLTIPDFAGNRYFNTLGNMIGEPRAALLFVDFETGNLLQLQGMAEIDWDGAHASALVGAERLWRFHIVRGWRRAGGSPLRAAPPEYAPTTLHTGTWSEAAHASAHQPER